MSTAHKEFEGGHELDRALAAGPARGGHREVFYPLVLAEPILET